LQQGVSCEQRAAESAAKNETGGVAEAQPTRQPSPLKGQSDQRSVSPTKTSGLPRYARNDNPPSSLRFSQ